MAFYNIAPVISRGAYPIFADVVADTRLEEIAEGAHTHTHCCAVLARRILS